MEQVLEGSDVHNVAKLVKKLKIKEPSLKQYSMKLASEYMTTEGNIDNLQFEEFACKAIEEECVNGLYKQHLTINSEPKMSSFYEQFNYENLMEKYEKKVDEYRNYGQIYGLHSKKELIHRERTKIIDMMSRKFASNNFDGMELVDVANLSKREIEKLYKKAKSIIEEEVSAVMPEEREIIQDNHLGKLQFVMTNYYYQKDHEPKEEEPKKHKFTLWEWIKHILKIKQPKLLEEGMERKRENKLNELKEILKSTYYETDFAGCFRKGKIEDRVHIMQIDEENLKDKENISERREMIKNEILVKV